MTPTTTKQWNVTGRTGFDCLQFNEKVNIPKLGDHDVLVHFHSVSLNYRDLIITKVIIPASSLDQIRSTLKPGH